MQKQQISKFFEEAGFDYREMELNRFYPITGWEILTYTPEGNDWRKVTHLVRKERCVPVVVKFNDTKLSVSPEHRFWVSCCGAENWIEAIDLVEEKSEIKLLHEGGDWVIATFEAGAHEVDILDMTVEGAESYFSDGVLSHNTMYGDPTTTPGGNAIPFHASVRVKLGAGQQIKGPKDEVLGIHVSAKTIKNKVAPPFRTANFRIIFGKGIEEHEEMFDLLREHGPVNVDGKTAVIEGTGSWKSLKVTEADSPTTVLFEKKFYKSDFSAVINDPQYRPWVNAILDAAMVRTAVKAEDMDVDTESYEDVRSLVDSMNDMGLDISPE